MAYFNISLRCGERTIERLGMLEFASLDEARQDVTDAIPDTAADLIRQGLNPLNCRFSIADENNRFILDVPLGSGIDTGKTTVLPRPSPSPDAA